MKSINSTGYLEGSGNKDVITCVVAIVQVTARGMVCRAGDDCGYLAMVKIYRICTTIASRTDSLTAGLRSHSIALKLSIFLFSFNSIFFSDIIMLA